MIFSERFVAKQEMAQRGPLCQKCGMHELFFSDQGICEDCEFAQFPDRFTGCTFCHARQTYQGACVACQCGFEEWTVSMLTTKSTPFETKQRIRKGVLGLLENKATQFKCSLNTDQKHGEWKGFYCADGIWRFPLIAEPRLADLTDDNQQEVVMRELKNMGISLGSEIMMKQINLAISHVINSKFALANQQFFD